VSKKFVPKELPFVLRRAFSVLYQRGLRVGEQFACQYAYIKTPLDALQTAPLNIYKQGA